MKTDKYKYTAAIVKGEDYIEMYENSDLPDDDILVIVSNSLARIRGFIDGIEYACMFTQNITKTAQGEKVIQVARENDSAKKL